MDPFPADRGKFLPKPHQKNRLGAEGVAAMEREQAAMVSQGKLLGL